MTGKNIRILICDDHELVRSGLIEILKSDDFFVIGQAQDGLQMIDKYFSTKPDIVLADIAMPRLSGLEAAKEILSRDRDAKILLVTMYFEEQYVVTSYILGIMGLLGKDISKDELILAVKTIAGGVKYFGPAYPEDKILKLIAKYKGIDNKLAASIEVITEKEEEILKLLAEGLMSSEMAERLNVGKKTIDAYRYRIMQKFNLKSLSALIKFAIDYNNSKNMV